MNWDALGAIAELVGAIAVLLTLIYLAVQIRQNNKLAEVQLMQAESSFEHFLLEYSVFLQTNQEVGKTLAAMLVLISYGGERPITHGDYMSARYGLMPLKVGIQNCYQRYKQGLISESVYLSDTLIYLEEFGGYMLLLDLPMTEEFRKELCKRVENNLEKQLHSGSLDQKGMDRWQEVFSGRKLQSFYGAWST